MQRATSGFMYDVSIEETQYQRALGREFHLLPLPGHATRLLATGAWEKAKKHPFVLRLRRVSKLKFPAPEVVQ